MDNSSNQSNENMTEQNATPQNGANFIPSEPLHGPFGNLPYVRNPGLGLGALFGAFFIMLTIVSVAIGVITAINGDLSLENGGIALSPKAMRIITVIQDILVFILPAVLAAMVATRLPANLLTINVKPKLLSSLLAMVTLFVSMPVMDYIIHLNESITFPESLAWFEELLRGLEEDAGDAVESLAGESTWGNLVIGILIIGILTGISEELFFRGAMQNLFMCTRMRKHLCIWVVAIIFSFMHFQFFGFIPRVLLGAYFGYLIWWTGSVWTPIIAHATNNSLVVIFNWVAMNNNELTETAEESASIEATSYTVIVASAVLTAFLIYQLRKFALAKK